MVSVVREFIVIPVHGPVNFHHRTMLALDLRHRLQASYRFLQMRARWRLGVIPCRGFDVAVDDGSLMRLPERAWLSPRSFTARFVAGTRGLA
jgi:hypothetical protein